MSTQPDYVSFEPNAREELLAQIGTFSPLERTLFQRLCESWSPVIDRNRFLSRVGGSEQEATALDRLMAKLQGAQLGLVTTAVVDGKRVPLGLILSGKGDLSYFVNLIEEETRKLLDNRYHVLPSVERLEERRALPPDYHVSDADSVALAEAYLADKPEPGILGVRLLGQYRIVVSTRFVRPLITAAVAWMRTNLDERGFLEEIARVKNTGIMELKQRLGEKTPDFWLDLTRTIVQERQTIAFRKNIDESDELFQTAYLIMTFTDAQIGVAKARKEHDNEVDEELIALAASVESASAGTMSAEDLTDLVEKAKARLKKAAGRFVTRMTAEIMTPKPRRKLPIVTCLAGVYIHRDRVKAVFESARTQLAHRLRTEYTDIMEAYLRGRAPEAADLFSSRADLDEDIRRRVEMADPVLGEMIARPQLLAEAIIRDTRLHRETITPEELRDVLAAYFDVKNSALLPPVRLFALDLVAMFDAAFGRLNVFRQLLLRLSGRYDSLRRSYVHRFGPSRSRFSYADDGDEGAPRGGRTRTDQQDAPGVRIKGTGRRGATAQAGTPAGRRAPSAPRRPKVKSPHEVERAWQDFGQALHTKPRADEDDFS